MHLIAEHDVLANYELANENRALIILAHQDLSGTEALTIVATFFIPPTFVSQLLSPPLLDWDSAGSGDENNTADSKEAWKRKLRLYTFITVPLMLLTFSVWEVQIFVGRLKQKKEKRLQPMTRVGISQGAEVISLMSMRMSRGSSSEW